MNLPTHFTTPPRRVPLSLAIVSAIGGLAQIGWFVFGFGMIFFWAFAGNADLSVLTFRGVLAQTEGLITSTQPTGASEGEQPVVANHYEYSVAGRRMSGTSYTLGSSAATGEKVTVEYKPDDPLTSRVEGMRRGQFGPVVLLVTIFPLIGLLIIYFSTRSGLRRAHLLRNGVFTTGKLVSREATNMTVNKRRVYELTFAFATRDGRRSEAKARSTDPSTLEDEESEPLLYDPEQPERVYVLDEVPARPQLDGTGELVGRPIAALFSLILPALVIGAHVWFFTR